MKEKKVVMFESSCDGRLSCKIHNATMSEVLASITIFINHCYNEAVGDDRKEMFKCLFENAYRRGLFWENPKKDTVDVGELDLEKLKVIADLFKRLNDK